MQAPVLETVFDEVFDSQETFRALLDAMSRPGRPCILGWREYRGTPKGLNPFAFSVMKTLLDHRVSFSLGGWPERPDLIRYLEMNTGASFREPGEADYVLFSGPSFHEDFTLLKRGSAEYPERSATALVSVRGIEDEEERSRDGPRLLLNLTGPGVKGAARAWISGLDRRYLEARSFVNVFYPMGIDVVLIDGEGRLLGVPRTCRVETA
jgi:alpha-D-ribose 1-methylphosphonate 5-triphosphate synthase subunit PhnH